MHLEKFYDFDHLLYVLYSRTIDSKYTIRQHDTCLVTIITTNKNIYTVDASKIVKHRVLLQKEHSYLNIMLYIVFV